MANIQTQASKPGLLRQLGFFSATALVISNMVGTGIFATTGFMAGDLGSAGLILACWSVGALFAFAGALSYSELGDQFSQLGRGVRVPDARVRAGVGLHDRVGIVFRRLLGAHRGHGAGLFGLPGALVSAR